MGVALAALSAGVLVLGFAVGPAGAATTSMAQGEDATVPAGWTVRADSALNGGAGITSDGPGSGVLSVAFTSSITEQVVVIGYANAVPDGAVRARLDGGAWVPLETYDAVSFDPARVQAVWSSVAAGAHVVEIEHVSSPGIRYWLDGVVHAGPADAPTTTTTAAPTTTTTVAPTTTTTAPTTTTTLPEPTSDDQAALTTRLDVIHRDLQLVGGLGLFLGTAFVVGTMGARR